MVCAVGPWHKVLERIAPEEWREMMAKGLSVLKRMSIRAGSMLNWKR